MGRARVYGDTKVSGKGTRITDNAEVYGTDVIRDNA